MAPGLGPPHSTAVNMELTASALAVFEATVRLSLGLSAVALFLDVAGLGLAVGDRVRRRRMVAVGWSAAPLLLLASILVALSGMPFGL